ncbi:hypothetical protein L3X38_022633 [Prunus dulcis]|uniref:Retroviral polymerase SH3-like domain-containing protein n=1 Tax=Prunus dulcis TaxID=3755 RepID=A0AAD4VWA7_PRUDU|nr:hypothetical protein L3X38_022633 [Prunus dulcis]
MHFFEWVDNETYPRGKQVVPGLLRRLRAMEEKVEQRNVTSRIGSAVALYCQLRAPLFDLTVLFLGTHEQLSSGVYALIPSDERTKLKPKSLEWIFLSFESGVKGFKISDPLNQKKIHSGDVVFDEKTMPMINVKKPEAMEDIVEIKTTVTIPSWRVFRDTPQV